MTADSNILFADSFVRQWAEVILPLAIPKVYTYEVPEALINTCVPGTRVEVIFGKAKKYSGIVSALITQKPAYPTKPILSVLDQEPVIYEAQLKFWKWISEYYMCSEGEVMAVALPAHLKLNSETILIYNEDHQIDLSILNDEEYLVAEALSVRQQLNAGEIQLILGNRNVYPVVQKLLMNQICLVWEKLNEKYKPKTENQIALHPEFNSEEKLSALFDSWKGAPKQMQLLLAFLHLQKTEGIVAQAALLKKSGNSQAQLDALCEKKILVKSRARVDRIKLMPNKIFIDFVLSHLQEQSLQEIQQQFIDKQVCLLHGVTGSGKTLLYIKLIEAKILAGKQSLYLLPEIALTSQIIRRLEKHFGGHVAIYHSKFNDQERIELWNKVRTRQISVVLGARSALFLPFQDLGLIIVDEEHDASYKQQDPAPRYHARDAAIYYASIFGSKVLLGSGTPSLESYHNALHGKYGLVELHERFGGMGLPQIELINTNQMMQKGKVMISPQLHQAIEATVEAKRQVILFQNRRGYHPYLLCSSCGHIPQCHHCDVSLTLHKYSNKLHCHYCGSVYPKLITCPACGNTGWTEKNFGTQKIEEQLETDFPNHQVARMDVDAVKGKHSHDALIKLFEQHRIDILVGTQMVVKGLDFEKVSLVGILDADGLLSFSDFRANERAFQLMEQVSGRAGRKEAGGKVLIQTSNVSHPVLQMVAAHDFKKFYHAEIQLRKDFFYPPYCRLIRLQMKHKDQGLLMDASQLLAVSLRQDFGDAVIGPAEPVIARLRNQYVMEIMIKLKKEMGMKHKKVIRHHINLLLSEKKYHSVQVVADVDPV